MNDLIAEIDSLLSDPEPAALPDDAGFQARVSQFAQLENRRRELEAALDAVSKRANKLKGPILEDMAIHGIDNLSAHGLSIFSRVDRFVRKRTGVDTETVCEALRRMGREDMVSDGYSASSLKSLVVEMMTEDQPVPEYLAGLLEIGEVVNLVTRK